MGLVTLLEGVLAVIGIVTVAASVRALAKARGVEASVELLTTANEGLRQANADMSAQRALDRDSFRDQLHAQELECQKQIAELRGEVSVLTGGLAGEIIAAVVAALPKGTT